MKKSNRKKLVKRGNWWFRAIKSLLTCFYNYPDIIYLDSKPFEETSVILSNHEGSYSPISLEMYFNKPIRLWGTYEMNSGFKNAYKYQTEIYYHKKKGWNLFLARIACLLITPLTRLFYKGLNIISVYRDPRFLKTMKESIETLNKDCNIVIYPEDSSGGYLKELKSFHVGFVVFAETCLKKGIDLPLVVAYYNKDTLQYLFDKPVKFSELQKRFSSRQEIADHLLDRCNFLGKMNKVNVNVNQGIVGA
jgi:hypothetical protein